MSNYSIGISGIYAAQKALEVIGNNIANAATEGYHRQRIELSPAISRREGDLIFGGGVEVERIERMIDDFIEKELLRQSSLLGQVGTEVGTLWTVENALGELSAGGSGLNAAIDKFFSALRDLSAHPGESIWQNQAVSSGEAMAGQFRTLEEFLSTLETQIRLEAENVVERVNTLASQIAELNDSIERVEIASGSASSQRDKRDKLITELSELVAVETLSRAYGVVDVNIGGIPLVMGALSMELEAGLDESGSLGISILGESNYLTNIEGGKIGGLLSLKNDLIYDIHSDLNSLASVIIQQINQYHVQGVGSDGSFTGLTGRVMASENLADFDPSVTDGKIYIRVTNTSTSEITRNEITVDASSDTLSDIATDISNITGLNALVVSSRLSITADANYKFDFLPCVLSSPTASTLTGTSPPTISVSGIYTGTTNDTFEFTVSGVGSVGNGTLQLTVKDNGGAGSVVATLNIGSGYAAGDLLDVGNGIKISVGTGDFGAGDNFDVAAFADSDTSGVLAAVGINTLFSGSDAGDIGLRSDISASPGRVATGLGADMTDNTNVLRMAGLEEEAMSSLSSLTCGGFYRKLVTDLGQQISIKQMRQDNIEAMMQNLATQQGEVSGVNINEEAAQLLIFEQMFVAMAKYIATVKSSLSSLMEIV